MGVWCVRGHRLWGWPREVCLVVMMTRHSGVSTTSSSSSVKGRLGWWPGIVMVSSQFDVTTWMTSSILLCLCLSHPSSTMFDNTGHFIRNRTALFSVSRVIDRHDFFMSTSKKGSPWEGTKVRGGALKSTLVTFEQVKKWSHDFRKLCEAPFRVTHLSTAYLEQLSNLCNHSILKWG